MGQYFILDGYSRGKHLHYDGNAILKLTDKGEDWLVDGDYLVRNTTEHNMVSVVRDGRSEKLEPECAALLHYADLPTHGFTETMMKNYNGVDWHRNIFWQKGGWIVLLDRMIARKPGAYKFDCVFKTVDAGAEELISPDRFRISRGWLLRFGNFSLQRAPLPAASGGAAVVFTRTDAQLQCGVKLNAGDYRVTLFARGVDTGSDSFWLSVDGDEPIAFHLPLDKIGPSSATPSKTTPTPEIHVGTPGEHVLTVTLRERTGPVLDRILIEEVDNPENRIELEAENAPPAAKRPPSRRRDFFIVNADGATPSVARRTGSSGGVKYLFQRRVASLNPGQRTAFQNLLYLDDIGMEGVR